MSARQGNLKLKKFAQDIVKLALLDRPGAKVDRRVLGFAGAEAGQPVRGRVRLAAARFEVETLEVVIPDALRASILNAQGRQIKVNGDQVADDVVVLTVADEAWCLGEAERTSTSDTR